MFRTLLYKVVLFLWRTLGLKARENIKIPVINARRHLLGYHLIHAVPTSVALYLISINLRGYYIGAHLGSGSSSDANDSVILAFIQVFAKIHVSTQQLLAVSHCLLRYLGVICDSKPRCNPSAYKYLERPWRARSSPRARHVRLLFLPDFLLLVSGFLWGLARALSTA